MIQHYIAISIWAPQIPSRLRICTFFIYQSVAFHFRWTNTMATQWHARLRIWNKSFDPGQCRIPPWIVWHIANPASLPRISNWKLKIPKRRATIQRKAGSSGFTKSCSEKWARSLSHLKRESCHWTKQPIIPIASLAAFCFAFFELSLFPCLLLVPHL